MDKFSKSKSFTKQLREDNNDRNGLNTEQLKFSINQFRETVRNSEIVCSNERVDDFHDLLVNHDMDIANFHDFGSYFETTVDFYNLNIDAFYERAAELAENSENTSLSRVNIIKNNDQRTTESLIDISIIDPIILTSNTLTDLSTDVPFPYKEEIVDNFDCLKSTFIDDKILATPTIQNQNVHKTKIDIAVNNESTGTSSIQTVKANETLPGYEKLHTSGHQNLSYSNISNSNCNNKFPVGQTNWNVLNYSNAKCYLLSSVEIPVENIDINAINPKKHLPFIKKSVGLQTEKTENPTSKSNNPGIHVYRNQTNEMSGPSSNFVSNVTNNVKCDINNVKAKVANDDKSHILVDRPYNNQSFDLMKDVINLKNECMNLIEIEFQKNKLIWPGTSTQKLYQSSITYFKDIYENLIKTYNRNDAETLSPELVLSSILILEKENKLKISKNFNLSDFEIRQINIVTEGEEEEIEVEESEIDSESETESMSENDSTPQILSVSKSRISNIDVISRPDSVSETDSESQTDSDSETDSGSEYVRESDLYSISETDTSSESDLELDNSNN